MVNFTACSAPPTKRTVLNEETNVDCHWLRHSRTVDALWRPAATIGDLVELGVNCGPVAFAALAQLQLQAAIRYFPHSLERPWTNRSMMRRALRAIGYDYVHLSDWPRFGLCLVHFTGPWTQRGYPAAMLQNNHWIAVCGGKVLDINWNVW